MVSRYMKNTRLTKLVVAKHILQCFKGTLDYRIFYLSHNKTRLLTLVDANWIKDLDSYKSILNVLYKLELILIA